MGIRHDKVNRRSEVVPGHLCIVTPYAAVLLTAHTAMNAGVFAAMTRRHAQATTHHATVLLIATHAAMSVHDERAINRAIKIVRNHLDVRLIREDRAMPWVPLAVPLMFANNAAVTVRRASPPILVEVHRRRASRAADEEMTSNELSHLRRTIHTNAAPSFMAAACLTFSDSPRYISSDLQGHGDGNGKHSRQRFEYLNDESHLTA
jgi:hypothetical protein